MNGDHSILVTVSWLPQSNIMCFRQDSFLEIFKILGDLTVRGSSPTRAFFSLPICDGQRMIIIISPVFMIILLQLMPNEYSILVTIWKSGLRFCFLAPSSMRSGYVSNIFLSFFIVNQIFVTKYMFSILIIGWSLFPFSSGLRMKLCEPQ